MGYQACEWRIKKPAVASSERQPVLARLQSRTPEILNRLKGFAPTEKEVSAGNETARLSRAFHDQMVEQAASRIEPELYTILAGYGLSEVQIQQILSERRRLHYHAIEAGELGAELVNARIDFDTILREALPVEKYSEYRDFENGKRVAPAIEKLKEIATGSGHAFSEAGLSIVEGILFKRLASVRLEETWNGPYDPLPHPTGGISVAEEFGRELILFNSAKEEMLSEAKGTLSLPEFDAFVALLVDRENSIKSGIRVFEMSRSDALKHFEEITAQALREKLGRSP